MSNHRVERYLDAVAARLKHLPSAERTEQIQELRQHLEALVLEHRACGLSEGEAVDAALRQFGDADRIGSQLKQSWNQRQGPNLWVYACIYVSAVILALGVFITANDKPTDFPSDLTGQIVFALVLPAGTLAFGVLSYLRFKRARNRA